MFVMFRVCAEFHNKKGEKILTVRPGKLLDFMEAPEEIREDPLFRQLQADGSLEVMNRVEQKRALELDPSAGVTAEGKKRTPERKPGTRKKESEAPAEEKSADGAE